MAVWNGVSFHRDETERRKNTDSRITVIKKNLIQKKTDTRLIYIFFTRKWATKNKQTQKLICR